MRPRRLGLSSADAAAAAALVLTVLLATGYLVSDDVATRTYLQGLSLALSLVGLVLAVVLCPPGRRRAPALLVVGMGLVAVGEVVSARERTGGVVPYPNGGEAWAGAGSLVLLVAAALLVGRRGPLTAQERLDIGIGAVSVLLFVASSGLVTTLTSGPSHLAAAAFLGFAVIPVVAGVLVVGRPATSRAGMWLVVASLGLVSAEAGFVVGTVDGVDADGRLTDVGYLVARGLLVVLALALVPGRTPTEHEVASRRVLVAGAFALLVPAGFLVGADTGVQNPVWLTVLAGTAPVALLTWRAVRSLDDLSLVAGRDPLTGLANRRAFDHRLGSACAGDEAFVLLVADLDGFKQVNDAHGHAAGDRVLVDVAEGLRRAVPEAFVARLGGDEFAVLLPGGSTPGTAAAAVRSAVEAGVGPATRVGVSVGAALGRAGLTPDQVLAEADAAMYAAKQAAR